MGVVANAADLPLLLTVGTVIGGAMFGDNLSIISDTTIAATRTQGCDMRDKFPYEFQNRLACCSTGVGLVILPR